MTEFRVITEVRFMYAKDVSVSLCASVGAGGRRGVTARLGGVSGAIFGGVGGVCSGFGGVDGRGVTARSCLVGGRSGISGTGSLSLPFLNNALNAPEDFFKLIPFFSFLAASMLGRVNTSLDLRWSGMTGRVSASADILGAGRSIIVGGVL